MTASVDVARDATVGLSTLSSSQLMPGSMRGTRAEIQRIRSTVIDRCKRNGHCPLQYSIFLGS